MDVRPPLALRDGYASMLVVSDTGSGQVRLERHRWSPPFSLLKE